MHIKNSGKKLLKKIVKKIEKLINRQMLHEFHWRNHPK